MAVGVAGACVGETSAATFAGNGFGGLPDLLVVFAGAATLTGNGFR